jgi:lipopolysaccharide heptosyltransferase II
MKILIVNPFGIGDVIFSTPLVEILKKSCPQNSVNYLCNRKVSDLLRTNPNLDKVFVYEKDDYRQAWKLSKIEFMKMVLSLLGAIRREKFDMAIDLSLGSQYGMFLKILGVKRRIGFNYRNRGRFLTEKIEMDGFNDKHVVEYHLDVLKILGVDVKKYKIKPRVYLTEDDAARVGRILEDTNVAEGDLVIGLVPGCGASWGPDARYRHWGIKKFASLADKIMEKYGAKIILLGDSKDVEICKTVQGLVGGRTIMLCGKTTIGESLGLLSRCRLVVTNEGGPLHMAIGLGVRTVSIFGPVNERIYGPYPTSPDHIVISKSGIPCRPCYRKFKFKPCADTVCLDKIEVEDVLEGVDRLLRD